MIRDHWKVVLAITIVAFVGIGVLNLDYNDLQTARDADAFRDTLGDDRGRSLGAAVADMIFAAGYGALGVLLAQRQAMGLRSTVTAGLFAAAAVFDELENVLVFRNVAAAATTTDSWIDAMRAMGAAKLVFLYLAVGALAGLGLLRLVRRRRARPDAPS